MIKLKIRGILESYERDENQIMVPCIKTYNLNVNDKYEIIQISDSEIEEVLSKIQNLKNKQ